jgi:predicted transcriptional regulator
LNVPLDAIEQALQREGYRPSRLAIASARSSFRQFLKLLAAEGLIRLAGSPGSPASFLRRAANDGLSANVRGKNANIASTRKRRTMSNQRQAILDVLENGAKGPTEIATETRMDYGAVRFLLHAMVKSGEVAKAGHGRYRLP